MNRTIPFVDKADLEDSILYKPVKSLAPMIFPSIIKAEDEDDNSTKIEA